MIVRHLAITALLVFAGPGGAIDDETSEPPYTAIGVSAGKTLKPSAATYRRLATGR